MSAVRPLPTAWRVAEIFGPTLQGEGVDQGVQAHFLRLGGCDFKCGWCDTPHAVLPHEVKKLDKMSVTAIGYKLRELDQSQHHQIAAPIRPPWVIITGGNPCLHDLSVLVDYLHDEGRLVAVETQGTKWREWLRKCDRICVSPKPPSSGMDTQDHRDAIQRFLLEGMYAKVAKDKPYEWLFLKVVIFNEDDLDYAEKIREQFSDSILYLSAGNDAGRTVGNPTRQDKRSSEEVKLDLLDKAEWLTNEVLKRPTLTTQDVVIQAQFHVLIWGNELGH